MWNFTFSKEMNVSNICVLSSHAWHKKIREQWWGMGAKKKKRIREQRRSSLNQGYCYWETRDSDLGGQRGSPSSLFPHLGMHQDANEAPEWVPEQEMPGSWSLERVIPPSLPGNTAHVGMMTRGRGVTSCAGERLQKENTLRVRGTVTSMCKVRGFVTSRMYLLAL